MKRWLVIFLLFPLLAFAENFVMGKDYEIFDGGNDGSKGKKVTVTEFFSYGCPWCYRLESSLDKWVAQQANTIQFSRVPVIFNKDWIYYAKAYYTADLLKLNTQITPLLFKAIHVDKLKLNTNQAMIDFFISQGVNKETAESAFTHSTTVDMKVNEGNISMGRFHINAVPAFIINNRYKTDLRMAGGQERLFKILNYLIGEAEKKV